MTHLLGCTLGEALYELAEHYNESRRQLFELEKQGKKVHVVHYYGKRRDENANDERVVRVTEQDGEFTLVVCEFVTRI